MENASPCETSYMYLWKIYSYFYTMPQNWSWQILIFLNCKNIICLPDHSNQPQYYLNYWGYGLHSFSVFSSAQIFLSCVLLTIISSKSAFLCSQSGSNFQHAHRFKCIFNAGDRHIEGLCYGTLKVSKAATVQSLWFNVIWFLLLQQLVILFWFYLQLASCVLCIIRNVYSMYLLAMYVYVYILCILCTQGSTATLSRLPI